MRQGAVIGAAAGGIIGHQSGRALESAALGEAAGGAIEENDSQPGEVEKEGSDHKISTSKVNDALDVRPFSGIARAPENSLQTVPFGFKLSYGESLFPVWGRDLKSFCNRMKPDLAVAAFFRLTFAIASDSISPNK